MNAEREINALEAREAELSQSVAASHAERPGSVRAIVSSSVAALSSLFWRRNIALLNLAHTFYGSKYRMSVMRSCHLGIISNPNWLPPRLNWLNLVAQVGLTQKHEGSHLLKRPHCVGQASPTHVLL